MLSVHSPTELCEFRSRVFIWIVSKNWWRGRSNSLVISCSKDNVNRYQFTFRFLFAKTKPSKARKPLFQFLNIRIRQVSQYILLSVDTFHFQRKPFDGFRFNSNIVNFNIPLHCPKHLLNAPTLFSYWLQPLLCDHISTNV